MNIWMSFYTSYDIVAEIYMFFEVRVGWGVGGGKV